MDEPRWKNFTLTDFPSPGNSLEATVSLATLTMHLLLQVAGNKQHIAERLFRIDEESAAEETFGRIAGGISSQGLRDLGLAPNPDKKNIGFREEKRVKSPDDWHPTAPDGTVAVSLLGLCGPAWRVCVWGDDDDGMELDFPDGQFDQAVKVYQSIQNGVTKAALKNMGFDWA